MPSSVASPRRHPALFYPVPGRGGGEKRSSPELPAGQTWPGLRRSCPTVNPMPPPLHSPDLSAHHDCHTAFGHATPPPPLFLLLLWGHSVKTDMLLKVRGADCGGTGAEGGSSRSQAGRVSPSPSSAAVVGTWRRWDGILGENCLDGTLSLGPRSRRRTPVCHAGLGWKPGCCPSTADPSPGHDAAWLVRVRRTELRLELEPPDWCSFHYTPASMSGKSGDSRKTRLAPGTTCRMEGW